MAMIKKTRLQAAPGSSTPTLVEYEEDDGAVETFDNVESLIQSLHEGAKPADREPPFEEIYNEFPVDPKPE